MRIISVVTGLLAAGMALPASAYVIDANLAEWGLTRTGSASDWTPNTSVKAWAVEDQTGNPNTYLSPGYGGQAYDVEALYVDFDAQYLYLAMVTGHNPLTQDGGNNYAPGDFAIDFGRNGVFEFGLETTGSNGMTQGGLYAVTQWGSGLWGAANEGPTSILAGVLLGTGQVAYTTNGVDNLGVHAADRHFFYEARIPIALFGQYWGSEFDVHWTMNCANDSMIVDPAPGATVPEPGTLALLPLGLLGMVALARRRRSA